MTIIDKIINVIFDKSKSIGLRSWVVFFSLIALFTVDYIVNFTYDIHVSYKLETLEKINNLKKEYKNDSLYTIQLANLETEYKDRKHYYDYAHDYSRRFLNFSTSLFKSDNKEIIKSQIKKATTITKTNNPIRSNFWMFVSSNFFFILLTLFIFITPIFSKELNTKESLLGLFIVFVIVICAMLFANWTAYLIPILFNNSIWNYILNFVIHSTIITIISIIGYKSQK